MNRPTFLMMCGLPCSGKSTRAKRLSEEYNANIHSSDAIREELTGDINNQDLNSKVFETLHQRIKDDLRNGVSCIYDACCVHYKERKAFLQELKNIPCEKICILMATPYEICLERSTKRDRKVPEYVIKRMYKSFDPPGHYEGWDNIEIMFDSTTYGHPNNFYLKHKHFNQDNTHHTLTLGEHCAKVCAALNNEAEELKVAGLLHECGKPFCKTFINTRGEVTEQAHYYNHEHTGSYDSLFYHDMLNKMNPLYIATLIRWHMQPYFWEKDNNEKQHNKYRKLWGEELYSDIMKLHEADKAAH